jgi:hypothetical protein
MLVTSNFCQQQMRFRGSRARRKKFDARDFFQQHVYGMGQRTMFVDSWMKMRTVSSVSGSTCRPIIQRTMFFVDENENADGFENENAAISLADFWLPGL